MNYNNDKFSNNLMLKFETSLEVNYLNQWNVSTKTTIQLTRYLFYDWTHLDLQNKISAWMFIGFLWFQFDYLSGYALEIFAIIVLSVWCIH